MRVEIKLVYNRGDNFCVNNGPTRYILVSGALTSNILQRKNRKSKPTLILSHNSGRSLKIKMLTEL